jgi:CCR4-NOT transcription complex subunit 3
MVIIVGEIERTLKKVNEGLDLFHETLEKLNTTSTPNQKEKVETDLKKEIKKLQRLRDQIKGWQTLSEIKDKTAINDARRAIETEMERFKILEKEMKIKAFSKEGLNQQAKLDPKEKERMELGNWINEVVDKLNTGIDAFEAECESIRLSGKKSKKLEAPKQDRLNELTKHIERHKYHVKKLELVLRLLENERLEVDDVAAIKDDVEYYIESHGEADFMENEEVYDDLDLASSDESDEDEDEESDQGESPSSPPSASVKHAPPPPPPPAPKKASLPGSTTPQVPPPKASVAPSSAPSAQSPPLATAAGPSSIVSPKVSGPSFATAASVLPAQPPPMLPMNQIVGGGVAIAQQPSQQQPAPNSTITSASVGQMPSFAAAAKPEYAAQAAASSIGSKQTGYEELLSLISASQPSSRTKAELLSILMTSYQNCPDGFEMETSRSFIPKQPVNLPSYYPPTQPAILENPAIFERLDLDTLFFIFYYQQKTYPQYFGFFDYIIHINFLMR